MQPPSKVRASRQVLFAFVATSVLAFSYLGLNLGKQLADTMLPEAKRFYQRGGSIETSKLNTYRSIPMIAFALCGIVGAVVGHGFYMTWQQPKPSI